MKKTLMNIVAVGALAQLLIATPAIAQDEYFTM